MSPNNMAPVEIDQEQPISRTYQYRKVMKPMLERKRRARINKYLDELKDLMVSALQSEGENVNKLEKADVLELTVRHLQKLKRQQRLSANPVTDMDRFRAGFTHCANEVSKCLATIPSVDINLGTKLMTHLGHSLNHRDKMAPLSVHVPVSVCYSPPASPESFMESNGTVRFSCNIVPLSQTSSSGYGSDRDTSPLPASPTSCGLLKVAEVKKPVWRPW